MEKEKSKGSEEVSCAALLEKKAGVDIKGSTAARSNIDGQQDHGLRVHDVRLVRSAVDRKGDVFSLAEHPVPAASPDARSCR
jgi:hypothetical protein